MKPVKIFVEGRFDAKKKEVHSTDSPFLRDYVQHAFKQKLYLIENFKHIGGASEFKNMATDIRIAEERYEVLMIIDADGDPVARKAEIEVFQQAENLKFPYFLFPDDAHRGEVEVLLEEMANDKVKLKCYTDYEACIGVKLDIKDKIFAYIQAATGSKEAAKDKNRNFLDGNFNLDHACLEPLKKFLAPYF